ncbi:helix-turn-helix transcriptional regulator [Aeromonas salmonicida]|uniref:helix-turn-helix transcriptional regulator n=1 Tax=Aeromonas salmonicida TaxID=645 RepID=UPI00223F66E9|nr:helix-turn-helix transcriptional regulator [Aeromonas salmonicida]
MDSLNLNADELRDFRRVLDWSQQRMADELGVARNTINRMEKGHMAIEIRTALAVRYLAWHHSMIEKAPTKQPGQANVQAAPELGDSHKQVDLPLASRVMTPSVERRVNPAADAWAVYESSIADRVGFIELKERFFRVVEEGQDSGYHFTYLFFLQLLERLCAMPADEGFIPSEWGNIRCLRVYVLDFYKANPQWH